LNKTRSGLWLLPILLLLCSACGGSGRKSSNEQAGGTEKRSAPAAVLLTFAWTGGVAGFQRSLELHTDGTAAAVDKQRRRSGQIAIEAGAFKALRDSLDAVIKPAAGPYKSKAFDDFHYVIDYQPPGDRGKIHVEGDGTAFPLEYKPLLRRLQELTGRALQAAGNHSDSRR
jgi:hypothetical protein